MRKRYLSCNLCLFDGEGGGAAAAPAAAGDATATVENAPADGKERANNIQDAAGDRKAEFERLIREEYKDLYDENVQGIVKKRIKESKDLEKKIAKSREILNVVAGKYGIKDIDDYESITKAVQEDNTFFEDAAAKAGMTVEQYKHMNQMEREIQELKGYRESAERQKQADQIYSSWLQEAETVKNIYPNFNLQTELNNPQFGKLLGAGINLRTAFEAVHHDEIMTGAMAATAKRIAKKTADSIASRQSRPVENGMSSQASALTRADVSKLTRAERREYAIRARRGEEITF